jgi:hypothetical protein
MARDSLTRRHTPTNTTRRPPMIQHAINTRLLVHWLRRMDTTPIRIHTARIVTKTVVYIWVMEQTHKQNAPTILLGTNSAQRRQPVPRPTKLGVMPEVQLEVLLEVMLEVLLEVMLVLMLEVLLKVQVGLLVCRHNQLNLPPLTPRQNLEPLTGPRPISTTPTITLGNFGSTRSSDILLSFGPPNLSNAGSRQGNVGNV